MTTDRYRISSLLYDRVLEPMNGPLRAIARVAGGNIVIAVLRRP